MVNVQLVFVSRMMTLLVVGLTKCCVTLFVRQLFSKQNKEAWRLCNASLAVMAGWTVAATLAVSVGCSPVDALNLWDEPHCSGDVSGYHTVS